MKATGIVRHIDDLGRIVIPKEIRRTLSIREGDALEIYLNDSNGILFRKPAQNTSKEKAIIAQEWLEQNAELMKNISARFSIENKTTTCEIIKNGTRATGMATPNPDDAFIPSVEMVIALCRVTGQNIPQELLED